MALLHFIRRESNEISRFWLYPRMQIEKSERSKRDIVASRENGRKFLTLSKQTSRYIHKCIRMLPEISPYSIPQMSGNISHSSSTSVCGRGYKPSKAVTLGGRQERSMIGSVVAYVSFCDSSPLRNSGSVL